MSYLTHRAERAVLGALLADPQPPDHWYGLQADDFASRLHQQVFTALTQANLTRPGADLTDRDLMIAAIVNAPGGTVDDLRDLRADAPDPEHVRGYADLVHTAAVHRDLARYADTLTRDITAGTEPDDPDLAAHNRRLAEALIRHTRAYADLTADAVEVDYPQPVQVRLQPLAGMSTRADLEDQLLADLLRDPEQIPVVAAFLTDNAFSSPQRRHTYRAMLTLAHDGEPIDEVLLTWRIESETARAVYFGIDVNTPGSTPDEAPYPTIEVDTEPAPVYLARLATTAVIVPSAVDAARNLLVVHLRETLPDPATVAVDELARRNGTHPGAQPTPSAVSRPDIRAVPGYTTAQPPGPLPPADTPQPGPRPDRNPTINTRPGIRP
jgi:hypothetical protein